MSHPPDTACMDSLDAVWADIWPRLVRGKADRRSPLHTLSVGTIAQGGRPDQRIMVLRAVDVVASTLRFHTDARSSKVRSAADEQPVSVLGYDPGAKVQLRLSGIARVHCNDDLADAAWAASTLSSRRCYLAEPGPGTEIAVGDAGLPAHLVARVPTASETSPARAHFAVLVASIDSIDWLYLAAAGHRRARFATDGAGWSGRWLIP
ncbi:pyridoxamine 5'-phosphate oxidase family protein [Sphingobium algorifonticola]|uniref:Pyridoxamine 5'-phosphate oxidase Alr4036 family FMN-binding domain-containing protein n=1 Tax=Sphingobium algorifonticola TaxID=2008318 RepID=A0A437J697_9SPHN|nr:pyridoxamine 5'-phosphate oxidase family protein [Sphingobium algorifonticola]RVT40691.1 hypothetical protein ENE74_09390 [Sphingobium algorifonticola]